MSRPESTGSTIDISEIERSFPSPPRLSVSVRKTLPPLPLVLESPRASPSPGPSGLSSPQSVLSLTRPGSAAQLLGSSHQHQGETIRELSKPLDIKLDWLPLPPPPPPPPPPPVSKEGPRPLTASSKTLSFASTESKRAIKYGTGKHSGVELSPQPSDDSQDPLNWAKWRKDLNFVALLYMVALVGVMKTAFISAHGAVAMRYSISYTAAVALTAVPLMLSALAGTLSAVGAKVWGKRPVYLASAALMFVGAMLNVSILGDFSEQMAGRVFQGLGWGAFEALVLSSIQDTYFEHERELKITIYHVVATATTWGSPLLGGVASSGPNGFATQFEIIGSFLSVGLLLLAFGAPETVCDRSNFLPSLPGTARTAVAGESEAAAPPPPPPPQPSSRPWWLWRPRAELLPTKDAARAYLAKMKPWSYRADSVDSRLLLQAPRAMVAPTTALLFAVTLLPYAGLWSLASSLSLLFTPMPFMLSESAQGVLMTGPFLLTTAAAAAAAFAFSYVFKRFTTTVHVATVATGTVLASIGVFGFGLYVRGIMRMPLDAATEDDSSGARPAVTPLGLSYRNGDRLSLPVVSLLLGLLGAGSLALDAAARPAIQRSAAFTSPSLLVGLRSTADMSAGWACLRNLAAGALVLGLPNAVWSWDGLRAAAVGLGSAQVLTAAAACAAWWLRGEDLKRWDGRAMGLVDLSLTKRQVSFFDTT